MTRIEFDGLTFDDEAEFGFTISRWSGWWDAPAVRESSRDRPVGHGDFGSSRLWRAARVVTVEGEFIGRDMAETYAALTRLAALQTDGRASGFRVVEPFHARSAFVELVGAPVLPQQLYRPRFSYVYDVKANDPLKYGDPATVTAGTPVSGGGLLFPLGTNPAAYWDFGADGSSGRVSVTNDGTAPTWPEIEVVGGLSGGFVVADVTTGRALRFTRPIPDGSVVSVNQRTGRVSIDGQSDVSVFLTERGFFDIGPGETHQIQFTPLGTVTGTPQLRVTTRPAYF